ncbi:hypothetical protein DOM21_00370 [Bacteriovorax stolpii]|uniref:Uncharacterized protein n=1 Tax=Bacteriovorax stolpii TaxID=960 RepID=A0A2K9NX49_BACTC|nr:hypothetical protein [Bacteriovorax stolpii]AUO00071.1 hypothetical protein C0V70_18560 [Bacteriovorax stolpii]QDK39937.1 hypothetical protein DOM21_00370 [Bacteriovorax stolpii]TDP54036.1 hypothetical protein C8D79_1319 [Bacteriovorax stolpii]
MFLKNIKLPILFTLLFTLMISAGYAQNVLDDIEEEDRMETAQTDVAPNLVSETIKRISPSKKIFILTNENKTFSKGDFISLLLANKLVCRALVAKTNDEAMSGIKIVKIYNVNLWKQLNQGKEVLVLKGDDSYYSNLEKAPKETAEKAKNDLKVQDEDDLFNSTTLNDDDLSLEETSKRLIKTDNLLSAGVGLIAGKDDQGASKRYTHFNASWGYQLSDNIWAELGAGMNTINDYPSTGLDTRMVNITGKFKYTFNAPFYSYIMPYVGYQVINVDSPGAGVDDGTTTAAQRENELALVDDLKKSSVIFGVTVLKRIVPGWFIRADLGSDIISGGMTLEF